MVSEIGVGIMDLVTIVLVALALAMDAFAVSITNGLVLEKQKIRHGLRIAFFFGAFQGIMPLIGFLATLQIKEHILGYGEIIAATLLILIALRMAYEGIYETEENIAKCQDMKSLLIFSIATSIDALAVGSSLAFLGTQIIWPATIIAVITFCVSLVGIYLGDRLGELFKGRVEIIGAIILIIVAIETLITSTTPPQGTGLGRRLA
ncbi:hypothetical protein C9439_04400 [archaeon SCG-AAA382B04]|nr:hypothetical protein C9439_04400 [archaeon SCG-AAA382B04]